MSRDGRFVSARMVGRRRSSTTAVRETDAPHLAVLHLEDHLRAPINRELRHSVRALLCQGKRSVVVDLALVSTIDAAGVGELVRAYNMTVAANGVLQVVHPTGWVRQVLERVGLYELLCADRDQPRL
jgi:anti-anti-sigma factor